MNDIVRSRAQAADNAALLARREASVARAIGFAHPLFASRAENAHVWDVEGRRYIDFIAGIAVCNTGHNHPRVRAAVARQLERFTHTSFQVVGYEGYIELAERLCAAAPGAAPKKAFFMSAPRPAKAVRPPWGSSKVAKPHLLVSALPPTDSLAEWLLRQRSSLAARSVGGRLVEGLRQAILHGVMQPGQHMPSSRALADSIGASRNTVARRTLEDWGLALDPVPVGDDGASAPSPGQAPARLAYLTQSHQFPTGAAMPPEARQAWLAHARHCGTVLLEDDYDSEFRYNGAPFPSLQGLDAETGAGNRVIYLGSFSKTMFPGIRLAFLIVPPTLAEVFASAATDYDRDGDQLLHPTMARFIAEGHFAAHVRTLREEFGARRQLLVQSLFTELPGLAAPDSPLRLLGGLRGVHLALGLPAGVDDHAIARAAAARGVTAIPMSAYSLSTPGLACCCRSQAWPVQRSRQR